MTTDLAWFYSLPPADRISLLRDPRQRLTGELAKRLFLRQEAFMTQWWSNDGGASVELSATAAQSLLAVRAQLDEWWKNLDADQRAYIIGNRAGELEAGYHDVVQAPAYDAINKVPHADMIVVSDDKTGRFAVPRLTRVYVDMKAGGHE